MRNIYGTAQQAGRQQDKILISEMVDEIKEFIGKIIIIIITLYTQPGSNEFF